MEPMMVRSEAPGRAELADLVLTLAQRSTALSAGLAPAIRGALADLVRSMNCYYSNLIEGHDTHPVDIERALAEDYSADPKQRDLQLEAKAHIAVQRWIDEGGLREGRALMTEGIVEIHKRFCDLLPEDLLWAEDPESGRREQVVPGALRRSDVQVGRLVAISPGALPRFLKRFEEAYGGLGKIDSVLAAAAAHHRLLWLHPFTDGNGRVARLMSYAVLRECLDTGGVWSVARGLARQESAYKTHLANCDSERRGDLDGRGTLSEEALIAFTRFFLKTCIDQVEFMTRLIQPDKLRARVMLWADEEIETSDLPKQAKVFLDRLLSVGQIARGDLPDLLNKTERTAQRVTKALTDRGVVVSESTRSPLRLAFPASIAGRWLPGLFPDQHG
ncbi:MAG: Fic family protein [Gammaproteobacteria bacterium]|nr:Fic family protein [Gammaproteobacteria bacterium]